MLDHIREELSQRSITAHTTIEDWNQWQEQYGMLTKPQQDSLCKLIAGHTGIDLRLVTMKITSDSARDDSPLCALHLHEQAATDKINHFKEKTYLQRYDFSPLAITRSEWLAIINHFERSRRRNLTSVFFIGSLSMLRKESFSTIFNTLHPGHRFAEYTSFVGKRNRSVTFQDPDVEIHANPLIMGKDAESDDSIESLGLRATLLTEATPVRGYSAVHKTPGGTKVSTLCDLGKGLRFYKPLTPMRETPERGRTKLGDVSKELLANSLPKLEYKRAEPVEFTATLKKMSEPKRRRESSSKLMGASATEVFEAHDAKVADTGKHIYHWAHLIAHFLGDASEIALSEQVDDSELPVNLVPSTARANYNTLELIENFIRDRLTEGKTEAITFHVNPQYDGDGLIPCELIYTLTWYENNAVGESVPKTHIYYIRPQSHEPITKPMLKTVEFFRTKISDAVTTAPAAVTVSSGL